MQKNKLFQDQQTSIDPCCILPRLLKDYFTTFLFKALGIDLTWDADERDASVSGAFFRLPSCG